MRPADASVIALTDRQDGALRPSRIVARGVDRALLAALTRPARVPSIAACLRVHHELETAHALYGARGGSVTAFHRTPPPLRSPHIERRRHLTTSYEQVTFESHYEPASGDVSRARWLSYPGNQRAHAWVLRHADGRDRPWLFCLHGMGTGWPLMDFPAFRAGQLHHELGLNLVFPVMPLHGPRRAGHLSRAALASFELLDTFHGFSQALWDTRRLIDWARAQGATRIGAYGMSSGAHVASLVAMFEDLDTLIAGIPLCDMIDIMESHVPLGSEHHAKLVSQTSRELLALLSPFAAEPRTPHAGRAIYAGLDDLVTTAHQAERLWLHWGRPDVHWYPGAHVSFFWAPTVPRYVAARLRANGFDAR